MDGNENLFIYLFVRLLVCFNFNELFSHAVRVDVFKSLSWLVPWLGMESKIHTSHYNLHRRRASLPWRTLFLGLCHIPITLFWCHRAALSALPSLPYFSVVRWRVKIHLLFAFKTCCSEAYLGDQRVFSLFWIILHIIILPKIQMWLIWLCKETQTFSWVLHRGWYMKLSPGIRAVSEFSFREKSTVWKLDFLNHDSSCAIHTLYDQELVSPFLWIKLFLRVSLALVFISNCKLLGTG